MLKKRDYSYANSQKSPMDREVEKMNIALRSRMGTSPGGSDTCLHKCPVTEVSVCTGTLAQVSLKVLSKRHGRA